MSRLKIAIQKNGRLNEKSLNLLKSCDISIENNADELKLSAANFPIDILFLRNSDIPQYIEDGVADIGIIGENLLVEKEAEIEVVERLGFSKCKVCLAVPKEIESNDVSYFEGKKIATSYPNTLRKFLLKKNVNAEIHTIAGSVEIAPNIGLAHGVCDIVSTGNTLFKNGLRATEIILRSEAVLAKSASLSKEKSVILNKLLFRMRAVMRAKNTKYILLNVRESQVDQVASILPVLKSPTVLPLTQKGWCSLHSVIEVSKFWDIIDELKSAGAEDILIIPIDKMVL